MRQIFGILIVSSIGVGGFFLLRRFVKPTFYIVNYNAITHSGTFNFGGKTSAFGVVTTSITARNGYKLEAKVNANSSVSFNLYKDDKFIKTLDTK